jgi:hypothetical protein
VTQLLRFGDLRVNVTVLFEPRDMWIGVFWDKAFDGIYDVYLCVVPMLPIYFTVIYRGDSE